MTQLEFEEKMGELLTIPAYENWLLNLPKEKEMQDVAVDLEVACGCPLATYLRAEGFRSLAVGYEVVTYGGEDDCKIDTPEWAVAFMDLADGPDYPEWFKQTVGECLEMVGKVKRGNYD